MALYSCAKCGMSVLTTCGKCNEPLVDDHLELPDGSKVEIAKCPKCEGKIKSPLCCGIDMSCPV
jgi:DNA-directed RNA polymerase subunit RPC12/RpoP